LRDDLEQVAIRVVPVDASTTIAVIDLTRRALRWFGPVGDSPGRDPAVDSVELILADEKREMLRRDRPAAPIGVVERYSVTHVDDQKLTGEITRRSKSQDLDNVGRADLLILATDDQVV
jgi:hypothetical protein